MYKKIIPLRDRVVVKRVAQETVTAGGIHLPETVKEVPLIGEVVSVGEGYIREDGQITPLLVKEGDTVTFQKNVGQEIRLNGSKVLVLREQEILGIMVR